MQVPFCLALSLLFSMASFAASISYSYEELELGFTPTAMNSHGWITGMSADKYPFRYRPGVGSEQLSNSRGAGLDINDAGTVVGYLKRGDVDHAIVRPAGEPWTDIGTLGGKWSYASAINEAGQVVGVSRVGFGRSGTQHAFLYTAADGMTDLDPNGSITGSKGLDINESGQILIWNGGPFRFLFDPVEGMIDISAATGRTFVGDDLSDSGTIAGWFRARASVYTPSTNEIRTPATLGGRYSTPTAINGRGWMVGDSRLATGFDRRAFLYVYGQGLMDLNSLVVDLDVVLDRVTDINDRDQILASGLVSGVRHYYLLSRIREESLESSLATINNPEPSVWLLVGGGLTVIAMVRRRSP